MRSRSTIAVGRQAADDDAVGARRLDRRRCRGHGGELGLVVEEIAAPRPDDDVHLEAPPAAVATACRTMPIDGVMPPSISAAQSSTRPAPASRAARTPATESMQISATDMIVPALRQ